MEDWWQTAANGALCSSADKDSSSTLRTSSSLMFVAFNPACTCEGSVLRNLESQTKASSCLFVPALLVKI